VNRRTIAHSASQVLATDFNYVQGLAQRNFVGNGPLCTQLRSQLARTYGHAHVVTTDSGAAALLLALLALRPEHPGKTHVVTGAYVCPAVVNAIRQAGLEPVFADTRPDSLNIDMTDAARRIDARTLALVCTNCGGVADDYTAAAKLGVTVISDCAQALGTLEAGKDLASRGDCTILSFGPTKLLTGGGGGALLFGESLTLRASRLARDELPVEEYRANGFEPTWGQHFGDLNAGLVLAQLDRLDAMISRRHLIARRYDAVLGDKKGVVLVMEPPTVTFNRYRYYFLARNAAAWVEHMQTHGIDARSSISHVLPDYFPGSGRYPNLAAVAGKVVSLPIYPGLTDDQVSAVALAAATGPEVQE
jgi:perosamine synthetase